MNQARRTRHFAGIVRRARIARRGKEFKTFVKQWFRQIIGRLVNILGSGFTQCIFRWDNVKLLRNSDYRLDVIVIIISFEKEQVPNVVIFD